MRALRVLSDLMLLTERGEESAALNRRILEIDANNLIALNNLAWFLCEDKGQYAEALDFASGGRQIEPQYLDLIDTRGVIYYRMGRYEEAIQDFTEFLDQCPANKVSLPAARFHLARAYIETGRQVEAIQRSDSRHTERKAIWQSVRAVDRDRSEVQALALNHTRIIAVPEWEGKPEPRDRVTHVWRRATDGV